RPDRRPRTIPARPPGEGRAVGRGRRPAPRRGGRPPGPRAGRGPAGRGHKQTARRPGKGPPPAPPPRPRPGSTDCTPPGTLAGRRARPPEPPLARTGDPFARPARRG